MWTLGVLLLLATEANGDLNKQTFHMYLILCEFFIQHFFHYVFLKIGVCVGGGRGVTSMFEDKLALTAAI